MWYLADTFPATFDGRSFSAAVTLYRPTGPDELALVRESGYRRWPPRLDWQPIFYPVLNEEYAIQIARDWNAKDPETGYRGYVTRFAVRARFLGKYEIHRVGGRVHDDYCIPAQDLDELNENIVGKIEVVHEFSGSRVEAAGTGLPAIATEFVVVTQLPT